MKMSLYRLIMFYLKRSRKVIKASIMVLSSLSILTEGYTQTYTHLSAGTTTALWTAPSSSAVYYGKGNLVIDPTFRFAGSTGTFVASCIARPVQTTSIELTSPTEITMNFTNIGAYAYVASLTNNVSTIEVNLETNSSNINTVNRIHISDLMQGTPYSCTIQGYGGTPTIANSNVMLITTPVCNLPLPGIVAIDATQIDANVSWFPVTDPYGKSVTYEVALNGFATNISISDLTETSYKFTELEPSSLYNLTVKAITSNCAGGTTLASILTKDMSIPVLSLQWALPTILATSYPVTLAWDPVIGATSYNLSGGSIIVGSTNQTSFTLSEPCGQTQVNYRVRALSRLHSTNWSDALAVSIPACPPPPGGRVATQEEVDIESISEGYDLTAYPNPASDVVTIAMPFIAAEDTPIVFNDAFGNVLKTITLKQGEKKIDISTAELLNGLYLVRVGKGGLNKFIKVMVVHK